MTADELIAHTKRLIEATKQHTDAVSLYPQCVEFLRLYCGKNNAFLNAMTSYDPSSIANVNARIGIQKTLIGFLAHLEAGLHAAISPERKAQLDVVSDFLEMAQVLISSNDVHPASPAMLIGATLEEYLRTWVEGAGLPLHGRKPCIETYSQLLRDADLITKQDGKDITSWSGLRNHAAHGQWQEVGERSRVHLMLEGVNLFMRKYNK